jgi:hypothetical protein
MANIPSVDLDALVEHWGLEAAGEEELHPNLPLATLALEGIELACFLERYWEPHQELGLPGLKEYVRARFSPTIADEIRGLALTVQELQGRYNAEVEPPLVAPVARAEELLSELHRALSFSFDDGVETVDDRELSRVKQNLNDRSSHPALAMSLQGTANYAHKHRERLQAIPRFEVGIIDEALRVAQRLREQSGRRLVQSINDVRHGLRTERARVTRLLHDRMAVARRTIRYAFADQREVVERATSQYRRERRRQWRGSKRSESGDDSA